MGCSVHGHPSIFPLAPRKYMWGRAWRRHARPHMYLRGANCYQRSTVPTYGVIYLHTGCTPSGGALTVLEYILGLLKHVLFCTLLYYEHNLSGRRRCVHRAAWSQLKIIACEHCWMSGVDREKQYNDVTWPTGHVTSLECFLLISNSRYSTACSSPCSSGSYQREHQRSSLLTTYERIPSAPEGLS